jgi:hypothetical protein
MNAFVDLVSIGDTTPKAFANSSLGLLQPQEQEEMKSPNTESVGKSRTINSPTPSEFYSQCTLQPWGWSNPRLEFANAFGVIWNL